MDAGYDEDLYQNPFYKELRNENSDILEQCIANGWTLCVPRIGSFATQLFTVKDFLGHILVCNEELPITHFMTLTEKPVRVINKVISVEQHSAGPPLEIHILFEETFYTDDNLKYKIWCIESPLEPSFQSKGNCVSNYSVLSTLRDCIEFLWTESSGKDVLENMDNAIRNFKAVFIKKSHSSLNEIKDSVGNLYTNCLQIAFKNKRLKENSRVNKNVMDNVKLGVETYMHHGIYSEIFDAIGVCTAYEDASLNKIIRNLAEIQLRDLYVKNHFNNCIPAAKRNLSRIHSFSTVLEKVNCIKSTIAAINKSETTPAPGQAGQTYITTDDLLPILIFLVIKSGLPNWIANLNFIKHFRFSVRLYFQGDEVSFFISTMEAVIEHIQSGMLTGSSLPESEFSLEDDYANDNFQMLTDRNVACNRFFVPSGDTESIDYLFEQVKLNNLDKVKEILEKNGKLFTKKRISQDLTSSDDSTNSANLRSNKNVSIEELLNDDDTETLPELCHPLCTCQKCCRVLCKTLLQTTPTVLSCDGHGFTVLHIACIYGKPQIVELLLEMGAQVNAADFNGSIPLHYSASRGHQNALLLVLHAGAHINRQNMDKNTALHLACNNGHNSCVKALIYFSENCSTDLIINCRNDNGDTPLHLASKWGYESIVKLLLQYSADPSIKNNKGKSPIDVAHSRLISQLFISYSASNMENFVMIPRPSIAESGMISFGKVAIELDSLEESNILFKDQSKNCDISRSISAPVESGKALSIGTIRQVERLFRAITYGDTKLAYFYLQLDVNMKSEREEKSPAVSSNSCHPLCSCQKCSESKNSSSANSINLSMRDTQGNTALHVAARCGRLEICQVLLENGASVNIQNKNGWTAAHLAAQESRFSIVSMLVKYGADLAAKDSFGNTVLHLACIAGSLDIVKFTVENGSCVSARNILGKTPLDEAKHRVFLSIITFLESEKNKLSSS